MPKAKVVAPKGTRIQSVTIGSGKDKNKEVIKEHDCVLINPDSPSGSGLPFIAEVLEIIKPDTGDDIQLHVKWFYRPEEAVGRGKAFHGEKELFKSDHEDYCSYMTVLAKCRVLSLTKYQELPTIEENDFFARFLYRPAQQVFEPPKVPVFCVCEMPYNPDKFMVQCDQCSEWYHPECLRTTRKALKSQSNWKCPDCVRLGTAQCSRMQTPPPAPPPGQEQDRKRRKTGTD